MFEPLLGQDFIHLNGETVLNESTGAALDVTLELYGEGGCCLTWANRHVFQPRTLSYTVTLTTKHARREAREEAAAEQRAERERREESTRELNELVAQLTLEQHAAQVLRLAAAAAVTTNTTHHHHTPPPHHTTTHHTYSNHAQHTTHPPLPGATRQGHGATSRGGGSQVRAGGGARAPCRARGGPRDEQRSC